MWRALAFLLGVASVVAGVALLSVPLALIVGGLLVCAGAAALERVAASKTNRRGAP